MRRLVLVAVTLAVFASTAAAALTSPGYYWRTARASAAFRYAVWSSHSTDGIGLRCADQGRGACNFTVACRGLAANPSETPARRDLLRTKTGYRYRYFSCTATSQCFAGGSWRSAYRTNTALSANVGYDARHLRQIGGADPVANPAGCS